MLILVTGAAGYLGSAVSLALLKAGHQVTGVNHHHSQFAPPFDASYRSIKTDVRDIQVWREAFCESDAVVHLAATGQAACEVDDLVISQVLERSTTSSRLKCFIYTSGTMPFGNTGAAAINEDSPFGGGVVPDLIAWRPSHERRVLSSFQSSFRAIVVRPGFVYGKGQGIYGLLLDHADPSGCIRVPGSGEQRWPMVHVDDVAMLYALVIANGEAGVYHGVSEPSVRTGDLAEAIVKEVGSPQAFWKPWPLEEARREIGSLADGLALDQCIAAPRARSLGWCPQHLSAVASAREEVQLWKQRNLTKWDHMMGIA